MFSGIKAGFFDAPKAQAKAAAPASKPVYKGQLDVQGKEL